MLLSKCREELSARGAETKSLREESEAKEAQLETIISEMREEKRIGMLRLLPILLPFAVYFYLTHMSCFYCC